MERTKGDEYGWQLLLLDTWFQGGCSNIPTICWVIFWKKFRIVWTRFVMNKIIQNPLKYRYSQDPLSGSILGLFGKRYTDFGHI